MEELPPTVRKVVAKEELFDPQQILEDPQAADDPAIRCLRALLEECGPERNRLLKGREG